MKNASTWKTCQWKSWNVGSLSQGIVRQTLGLIRLDSPEVQFGISILVLIMGRGMPVRTWEEQISASTCFYIQLQHMKSCSLWCKLVWCRVPVFEYWYFHSKLWPRDWCSHAVGIMGVLELLRWRAPNPLILLLLLIQWNQQIPHTIEAYLVFS